MPHHQVNKRRPDATAASDESWRLDRQDHFKDHLESNEKMPTQPENESRSVWLRTRGLERVKRVNG